jgi:hypothetical protein
VALGLLTRAPKAVGCSYCYYNLLNLGAAEELGTSDGRTVIDGICKVQSRCLKPVQEGQRNYLKDQKGPLSVTLCSNGTGGIYSCEVLH